MNGSRSDIATFTIQARELVRKGDRRAYRRSLFAGLRRAAVVSGLGWSALVVAAFVLVLLPVNMRVA